jgi:hypothetical protein
MMHIAEGLSIRTEEDHELLDRLRQVWPRCRGYGKLAANSKSAESAEHREVFNRLISFFWPANTHLRFTKPVGCLIFTRSAFHAQRQAIAERKNLETKYFDVEN